MRIAAAMALLLGFAPLAGASEDPAVELIAHRGESFDAPENTLAAFRLAWERKVAAIELDVHLTSDGVLVVCHDSNLKRTGGVPLEIAKSTAAEVTAVDVGRWKGERWAGEKVPTLDQALATIPESGRCLIEVKIGPESVPALVKAIQASGKQPRQLAIISFNASTLGAARKALPEIDTYFLSSFEQDKSTGAWTPSVDRLIATARENGCTGLNLSVKGPIDPEFARQVKAAGMPLYIWTIDDVASARRMVDLGARGLTSNRAAWLGEQLAP